MLGEEQTWSRGAHCCFPLELQAEFWLNSALLQLDFTHSFLLSSYLIMMMMVIIIIYYSHLPLSHQSQTRLQTHVLIF
jgi:hypothetical protein